MKTVLKSTLLCTSLIFALAACSQKTTEIVYKEKPASEGTSTARTDAKKQIVATENMNSDELTSAGEQLIAAHSFHLADKVFEKALEKNPEDKKAQFYRVFLKRFMIFEGIATRVTPLVENYGNKAEFTKGLKNLPKHPMRNFLLGTGKKLSPIKDLADVQNFIADYRDAVNDLRQFIAKNADLELEIYLNPSLFEKQINEKMTENCTIKTTTQADSSTIADVECDFSEVAMVKMNMTDLMMLKQVAAAEVLYYTLYTSYSLDGLSEIIKKNNGQPVSTEKFISDLEKAPGALKLHKRQSLTQVRALGSDFATAMKWVAKYQDSLCPKNSTGAPLKRKGYIVPNICIENASEHDRTLALFEQILAGPVQQVTEDGRSLTINAMAIFDNPIKDLRQVAPASYDQEGNATSWKDKTFGGLFPNGDAPVMTTKKTETAVVK